MDTTELQMRIDNLTHAYLQGVIGFYDYLEAVRELGSRIMQRSKE